MYNVTSKQVWENLLESLDDVSFMQSWAWGEFRRLQGQRPYRFLYEHDDEKIFGQFFLQKFSFLPLYRIVSSFLPSFPNVSSELWINFLAQIPMHVSDYVVISFDIEPYVCEEESKLFSALHESNFAKESYSLQPSCTTVVDLTKPCDVLLSSFKPKTRYNIRLAEKKGVDIRILPRAQWDRFYDLLNETALRNHVVFYPKSYFLRLGDVMEQENMLTMFEAWVDDKLVASLFLVFYRGTATYLFGASSDSCRNTMANYLLHWKAMLFAKERGYHRYDFWGISDGTEQTKHWEGITRFKVGFQGRCINYPGLYRHVNNPLLHKICCVSSTLKTKVQKIFSR